METNVGKQAPIVIGAKYEELYSKGSQQFDPESPASGPLMHIFCIMQTSGNTEFQDPKMAYHDPLSPTMHRLLEKYTIGMLAL